MGKKYFVMLIVVFSLSQLHSQEFLIDNWWGYGWVEYDTCGRDIYADTFKINIDTRVRTGSPFAKHNMPAIAKKHRWATYISKDANLCLYNLLTGETTVLANLLTSGRKSEEYMDYSFSPNDSFIVITFFIGEDSTYYYSFKDKKLYSVSSNNISGLISWTEKDTRLGWMGLKSDTLFYVEYDYISRQKDTLFRNSPVHYYYSQTVFSYNRIKRYLAYSTGMKVHLFDPATKKDTVIMTPNSYTTGEFGCFAWSPSGDKLAFSSQNNYFSNIHICDLKQGTIAHRFPPGGTWGYHAFLRWLNEDTLLYLRNNNGIFGLDTRNLTVMADHDAPPPEKMRTSVYPNPFNSETTITYDLPIYGIAVLKIYDILGNEIRTVVNEEKPAGRYTVSFNASYLPSGTYFYELVSGSYREVKKMVILK